MDDLAASYPKLINLDHVSPLNYIATAHTTQCECVGLRHLPGAVGGTVSRSQDFCSYLLSWWCSYTASTIVRIVIRETSAMETGG